MFERTLSLIGSENLEKIKNSNIIVFGVGGVGGYVCEMLVRAGIHNLTIVDYDIVEKSNINRQIIALKSTIGQYKVDVMKKRLLDINPNANIVAINNKYTPENGDEFFNKHYDYVVDAIDMLKSKIHLINQAQEKGLKIVSAMGAGNRYQIPNFLVEDIYKTHNDGLAKVLRKQLKNVGVEHLDVVYTPQDAFNCGDKVGSISYFPAMCGCAISAFVINKIIEQNK